MTGTPELMARVGTRGRIVLLAISAALPMIAFSAYLLAREQAARADALAYGGAAIGAVLLVIFIAWYGAQRLVLSPIRTILETTARVTAGDLGARTGFSRGNEELSQLGAALDEMAERLEAHDRELKGALAELQRQAFTDALTGLYNRRFFWDALTRRIAEFKRKPEPFCVILLDIDHFKRVNDTWGHEAGDYVLREIGSLITASIRESDIAARYGGEEFSILLPDATSETAAERAESLRREIRESELSYAGQPIKVTVSLGVTECDGVAISPSDIMNAADAAMYRAKARGRDRVVVACGRAQRDVTVRAGIP